ncbi:MAG: tail fiber domain-containing protein, partial [Candidatus Aminicenantes bacterium]
IVGGAYCDGGAWIAGSSREYKENITSLRTEEAFEALEGLNPVRFNYKKNVEEDYVGFIAEDVPELVATKNRKGINTMDVVAVLTKVVQDQQRTIAELKERITELEKKK